MVITDTDTLVSIKKYMEEALPQFNTGWKEYYSFKNGTELFLTCYRGYFFLALQYGQKGCNYLRSDGLWIDFLPKSVDELLIRKELSFRSSEEAIKVAMPKEEEW